MDGGIELREQGTVASPVTINKALLSSAGLADDNDNDGVQCPRPSLSQGDDAADSGEKGTRAASATK